MKSKQVKEINKMLRLFWLKIWLNWLKINSLLIQLLKIIDLILNYLIKSVVWKFCNIFLVE
jgi:hypothetical protein